MPRKKPGPGGKRELVRQRGGRLLDKFDEFAATAPPRQPIQRIFYGDVPDPLASQVAPMTAPFRLPGAEPGPAPPVYGAGNINLSNRPEVLNPDGSVSTVRSISGGMDGFEVLVPTVSDDGRIMSDEEAFRQYTQTGRNLGKFSSPDEADAYAKELHERQSTLPVQNAMPVMRPDTQSSMPVQRPAAQSAMPVHGERQRRKRRAVP